MIDNPFYNGDYIAQAKAEIIHFMAILDSIQKQKAKGLEYDHGNRLSMDIPSFPSYSFHHFKKFTDEKLSSANPIIYITDLDEIYSLLQKCISKYCQIIESQIPETEKVFAEFACNKNQANTLANLIYFEQAYFCFLIKNYYVGKRKLFEGSLENVDKYLDLDYFRDKEEVREILGNSFDEIADKNVDIIISHILFYKYGGDKPAEIPVIHLVGVSQRKLIDICIEIVEKYNWDHAGRKHLSVIFGALIHKYENYSPVTYNKNTILKNMYKTLDKLKGL